MYTKDGTSYYILDGHTHFWDGSPANQINRYGEGFIKCFYDYHANLSPAEYRWSLEEFERYPEERMIHDLFETGYEFETPIPLITRDASTRFSKPVRYASTEGSLRTTAYLMPFLAITATAMLTSALSAGFEWLYPIRVVAAGVALWAFRRTYANLNWTLSWSAIAIGFATFVVWLVLMPATANGKDGWPAALQSVPLHWAAAWLLFRLVGYVITVPLAEELAFRGFLTRRLARADFQNLPLGFFSWGSFLISSALFGALHGGLWLAGTIAGMSFALALYRRGAFGDAVQAHATTNGLIALYAFTTGHWSVWS